MNLYQKSLHSIGLLFLLATHTSSAAQATLIAQRNPLQCFVGTVKKHPRLTLACGSVLVFFVVRSLLKRPSNPRPPAPTSDSHPNIGSLPASDSLSSSASLSAKDLPRVLLTPELQARCDAECENIVSARTKLEITPRGSLTYASIKDLIERSGFAQKTMSGYGKFVQKTNQDHGSTWPQSTADKIIAKFRESLTSIFDHDRGLVDELRKHITKSTTPTQKSVTTPTPPPAHDPVTPLASDRIPCLASLEKHLRDSGFEYLATADLASKCNPPAISHLEIVIYVQQAFENYYKAIHKNITDVQLQEHIKASSTQITQCKLAIINRPDSTYVTLPVAAVGSISSSSSSAAVASPAAVTPPIKES